MVRFQLLAATTAAIILGMTPLHAADWPERPVRVVIGFGAGGGTDIIGRIIAEPLSEKLGQPVVIENRPGAGGTIGADSVAKAEPDGYTMLMMNNGHGVAAAMYSSLPYHPIDDFEPVSMVASIPFVVVANPVFEPSSISEIRELSGQNTGGLNYGSVGVGSSQHFAAALIQQLGEVDATHIPYQGSASTIAAVLGGEVDFIVEAASSVLSQIRGGDLKAIGVTSVDRYPVLPDVPAISEIGIPGFNVTGWTAYAFPHGTPREIVDRFNAALAEVVADESVRDRALAAGYVIQLSTPEELRAHLENEVSRWSAVRAIAGIPQQ